MFNVHITGAEAQSKFLHQVEMPGKRGEARVRALARLADVTPNTNVDTIPPEVWHEVIRALQLRGMTHRQFANAMGVRFNGGAAFAKSPSRPRLARIANVLEDESLRSLSTSDVFWDSVVAIEPLGPQPVFDATVEGTHNFIANGIVAHNSIEQDADVVMFIYRDEVYNSDSPNKGIAEIDVAKHRNGPIGKIDLAFLDHYTRFANLARGI